MSDSIFGQDDEQSQGNESQGVRQLREAHKEMKAELERLRADARKRQVEDLLPPGVNKKVASLYQGEPEGFSQWFEANKDVFGGSSTEQPAAPATPQVEEDADTDDLPAGFRESMQRVTEGETGTSDATAGAGELAKLDAFIAKHGRDVTGGLAAWGTAFQ